MFAQVYKIVQGIPVGKVATYGQIARIPGTRDFRRVWQALHTNKNRIVPCHRVVFADGSLAPRYAFGGGESKKKRLLAEGVEFVGGKVYNGCILKERWK